MNEIFRFIREESFYFFLDLVVVPVILPDDPDPQVGVAYGGGGMGVSQLPCCTF